jgi:hypothetical protein
MPVEARRYGSNDASGATLIAAGQSYIFDSVSGTWFDFYSKAASEGAGNFNIKGISRTTSLTSLALTSPATVNWVRGSAKPLNPVWLTAKFSTGLSEQLDVSDTSVKLTGVNTQKKGVYTATATYEGKSVTFKVNVVDRVTSIRTPLSTIYLKKGSSYTLPVITDDGNVTASSALTYTSSNTKALKVSSKGKLTASKSVKKKTKVTVTITTATGFKKNVTVYVVPKSKKLSKLKVSGAPSSMKKGQYKILKVKLTSSSATNVKVTFSSSNKKVLTVDKAGKLFAKKKGSATVTVKAGGKSYKKKIKVK